MSTPPIQPETTQSDPKPSDPLPDQPPSDSPAAAAAEGEEEEEEEGECGFCLFMKGGGCKDTFIAWEDCVKEAEDKNEDLVEKCAQVTAKLKECMDANSDYYEPILRAEKHAEEQVTIELEKEKQDLAASQNQQEEAASNQNDHEFESKEISTPPTQAEKEQPVAEAPKAENKEEEGDCGFCLFMKGDGCRNTLVEWENCVKEAKENKEDLAEKCSQVTTRLLQCMDSNSDYYKPIIRTEKHVEEQAPSQSNQIDRELESKATSTPLKQDENEQSSAKTENISPNQPEECDHELQSNAMSMPPKQAEKDQSNVNVKATNLSPGVVVVVGGGGGEGGGGVGGGGGGGGGVVVVRGGGGVVVVGGGGGGGGGGGVVVVGEGVVVVGGGGGGGIH